MLSPALQEKVGPHPLENRLSGLLGLLILTEPPTTDNKPGRTRKADMKDEQQKEKKGELMNTRFQVLFFIVIHHDRYHHANKIP